MARFNILYGNISINEGARLMGLGANLYEVIQMGLGASLYEVFLVVIGTGFCAATYVVVDYFVNR